MQNKTTFKHKVFANAWTYEPSLSVNNIDSKYHLVSTKTNSINYLYFVYLWWIHFFCFVYQASFIDISVEHLTKIDEK